eukprot:CAMPEP_0206374788 /NCGR_PEP_ID=MMETSP0294-20121207/8509_1 /ASSEMBLY_ACC=CAM_ASM_000327 /TAXON_ID=39354 /ORGANISM="Heterosigma akashiwo, Strain CCMP2393" /LENGTH=482 /DNA_ID=CAMNT_0053822617 /DNA_START=48 /DNA_END=1496 /DNA_ORIENTATION=+
MAPKKKGTKKSSSGELPPIDKNKSSQPKKSTAKGGDKVKAKTPEKKSRGRSASPGKPKTGTPKKGKKKGKAKKKSVIEEEVEKDPLADLIYPEEMRPLEEILAQNTLTAELARRTPLPARRERSTACTGRVFEWLSVRPAVLPAAAAAAAHPSRGPETDGRRVLDEAFEERCIRRIWHRLRARWAPLPLRDQSGASVRVRDMYAFVCAQGERIEGGYPHAPVWQEIENLLRTIFFSMPGGDVWAKRIDTENQEEIGYFEYCIGHADLLPAMQTIISGTHLVKTPNRNGNLLLHLATKLGNVPMLRTLLIHGSLVDAPGAQGNTALHLACAAGAQEAAELLLHYKADPDAGNTAGETPLLLAAGGGHLALCQALLAAGADRDAASAGLRTPLMAAAAGGHLPVAKLLVEGGADYWATTAGLQSALLAAGRAVPPHPEVVAYLYGKQRDRYVAPPPVPEGEKRPKTGAKKGKAKSPKKGGKKKK